MCIITESSTMITNARIQNNLMVKNAVVKKKTDKHYWQIVER